MLIERQKYNLNKLLERYSFQHLRPPPEVKEIIIPEQKIYREMGNGQKKRHIYWGVQYTENQISKIEQVKNRLHEKCIFQKFTDQIILKHLYASKFDLSNTLQRLLKLQQFHNNKIITRFTRQTLKLLQSGCIYSYGQDKQYNPLVIVRVDKFIIKKQTTQQIDLNFNCVYYLLMIVINFKMTPYHNQKYVTIMDFNDMDITSIPFKFLFEIFNRMNIYYCGNSQRAFLYNSKGIQNLWNFAKKILTNNSFKNIFFIEKGKQNQILNYVEEYQIQQKYGGKLQNLTKFWPPKSTNQSFDQVNMTDKTLQTAFYSVQNDMEFFIDQQEISTTTCGQNCKCSIY